ncbi:hypothetical protein AVEN_58098-1 [Araneus ventricosus]|uniref:Uncharacterized protein n=1 Tax=Araneus ventricosus TaxID=182803 RepID=A0A4Y2N5M4_ARAVE|nr:hypothetical protein AVEN_58098-1 [Araneus ventricosus]
MFTHREAQASDRSYVRYVIAESGYTLFFTSKQRVCHEPYSDAAFSTLEDLVRYNGVAVCSAGLALAFAVFCEEEVTSGPAYAMALYGPHCLRPAQSQKSLKLIQIKIR